MWAGSLTHNHMFSNFSACRSWAHDSMRTPSTRPDVPPGYLQSAQKLLSLLEPSLLRRLPNGETDFDSNAAKTSSFFNNFVTFSRTPVFERSKCDFLPFYCAKGTSMNFCCVSACSTSLGAVCTAAGTGCLVTFLQLVQELLPQEKRHQ